MKLEFRRRVELFDFFESFFYLRVVRLYCRILCYPHVADGAVFVKDENRAFRDSISPESSKIWQFETVDFYDFTFVVAQYRKGQHVLLCKSLVRERVRHG